MFNLALIASQQVLVPATVFQYDSPTVVSVLPALGGTAGGSALTIAGANFGQVCPPDAEQITGSLWAFVAMRAPGRLVACATPLFASSAAFPGVDADLHPSLLIDRVGVSAIWHRLVRSSVF